MQKIGLPCSGYSGKDAIVDGKENSTTWISHRLAQACLFRLGVRMGSATGLKLENDEVLLWYER